MVIFIKNQIYILDNYSHIYLEDADDDREINFVCKYTNEISYLVFETKEDAELVMQQIKDVFQKCNECFEIKY